MIFRAKVLAAAVSAILLSACGGMDHQVTKTEQAVSSDASATETKEEASEDTHDHDEAVKDVAGRLLVTSSDNNVVNIYSTADQSLIESVGLTSKPQYAYGSENHRYAILVQRNDGMVEFVDGGLYREAHGDHYHNHEDAPSSVSFQLTSTKPTHVTVNEGGIAVFSDGDEDTQQNASVAVFGEAQIGGLSDGVVELEYNTHMHGAAQARGEYLVSSLRDSDGASNMPSQIALYHAHDDHFDQEQVFDVTCPVLHGSAQNEHTIVFGCDDGVAVITQQGGSFSATKVANPESFTEGMRIGSLKGHHHSEQFIASTRNQLFILHPEEGELEALEWQSTNGLSLSYYGFSHDGEHIIALDSAGKLSIFAGHTHEDDHESEQANENEGEHEHEVHWEVTHEIAIKDAETTMPEGHSFSLAVSHSEDAVFVGDPIEKQIKKYDLESGELVQTIELDVVPDRLVWLGIASSEEAHDHDH
ncbi:hypothetical protein [Pseudoalteromonas rubra]|uniref:5-methyltetrahydrofolate--homocysteine methyltransferase n=1 Tax=Pseudoalteromonas rubra TaxID=43658 RepID=A0A0U3I649_9GAMM|nr:hypothetical protein [Pseudoalteromonas rubra]ALU43407.1 hypothetical protein AT705_10895 [Pseudoalteromonas rubra]